jgi:hypothetical protein
VSATIRPSWLSEPLIQIRQSPLTIDEAAHRYHVNGREFISVTTVLRASNHVRFFGDLLDDFTDERISLLAFLRLVEDRRDRLLVARDRGKRVHQALHYLFEDDLDEASVDDEVRGYLTSARKYLDAHVQTVHAAELRVWSLQNHVAGTLDLFALYRDGHLSIADFKTGDPDDVSADLQTAGYEACLREMVRVPLRNPDLEALAQLLTRYPTLLRRRSVRLFRDGRPAKETLYRDPRDYSVFLAALANAKALKDRPAPAMAWDDER